MRDASAQMVSTCVTHDKEDVRCKPRYLYEFVGSIGIELMLYAQDATECLRENDKILHFERLSGISDFSHHEEIVSRSS